jgi:uncharacterized membrane protein YdbT with pleckstrin-like domain
MPYGSLVLQPGPAKTFGMAEETLWRGSSSQWTNLGRYLLATLVAVVVVVIFLFAAAISSDLGRFRPFLLLLLAVPIFMALKPYLQTKSRVYELTTERLKTTEGIFSKVTETLELYRVKDIEMRQPFLHRLVGVENVQLNTSDATTPLVVIEAVPSGVGLADKVRNAVEAVRMQKRVREIDIE